MQYTHHYPSLLPEYTFHEKSAVKALRHAVEAIEKGHLLTAESLAGDAIHHLRIQKEEQEKAQ
jgi:hypothetical protein